jgi:septal ring factor EnvC (AmiA/AmiB activator)
LLDKKNQEADETIARLEVRTKELDELTQELRVSRKKVADQATDLVAQADELKKLVSVKNLDCKQSLAIVQQTRAECDKKKSDAESLNAQAKANQQQASELIERCAEAADKKFAECKKICESANLPPFWPQRLSAQSTIPFLESRVRGIFL